MRGDDPYTYPYPYQYVLRNRFDIRDVETLDAVERRFAGLRARGDVPSGNFDLEHLKAIHRHLFQDVYDWAGETRTVEIWKGETHFQFPQYISSGMAYVSGQLEKADYLRNLSPPAFATQASAIMGDVNYAHPFREGNGRAQLQYLKQLAEQAGHPLDLREIDSSRWIAASQDSYLGSCNPMAMEIGRAIGIADFSGGQPHTMSPQNEIAPAAEQPSYNMSAPPIEQDL